MKTEISALREMAIEQLRVHWRTHCDGDMPQHGSRDLLVRAIVYQQEAANSAVAVRKARQRLDRTSAATTTPLPRLSPGTVLVREWNGTPYAVTVTEDGFLWKDKRYSSLSAVATAIAGVRWNGPRFFKLDEIIGAKAP